MSVIRHGDEVLIEFNWSCFHLITTYVLLFAFDSGDEVHSSKERRVSAIHRFKHVFHQRLPYTSAPNKSKPMVKAITLRCSAELKHKSRRKLSEMNETKLIV